MGGVENNTGTPILHPDGVISETGHEGASWDSLEDFICEKMKEWGEKG